jgi:hypothetical protein
VILVDPGVAIDRRRRGSNIGLGADTSPAVFPRVEVVRIDQQQLANLFLVPHQPLPVPRTRRPRWCDVVGVAVATWPTEEQLQSAPMLRLPSVDEALVHVYGTDTDPRLSPADMQLGWQVQGVALDRPGPYSADARPVARLSDSTVGDRSAASRRARRTWLAVDAFCEATFEDSEQDFYNRLHAAYPDMPADHMQILLTGVQVGAKADLCP